MILDCPLVSLPSFHVVCVILLASGQKKKKKVFFKNRKEKDRQCLNFSGFSCYFHCLDSGPYFSAAGTRADANSDAPACPGGLGKASSGICPSSCGLLAGGHDPAHERCRDQRGNWTATKNSRYLPAASCCCMQFPGGPVSWWDHCLPLSCRPLHTCCPKA